MRITTYGHCCLLIETEHTRILTDPGTFSPDCSTLTDIDIVLITHEHQDHLHVESLEQVRKQNPTAHVICNESVGQILSAKDIEHTVVEHLQELHIAHTSLKAYEGEHVEIFDTYGLVQNTGFLIAGTLFYPGDAYTIPAEAVDTLAVPVAGPWCKVSDAIRYALAVQPRLAFPVHDGLLNAAGKQVTYPHYARELAAHDIEFRTFTEHKTIEI